MKPILVENVHAGEYNLQCPVCDNGGDYNHIQEVLTLTGSDQHEAIDAYPGTQSKGHTPARRSALVVRIEGESCGHVWDLIIQQHKGILLVTAEPSK